MFTWRHVGTAAAGVTLLLAGTAAYASEATSTASSAGTGVQAASPLASWHVTQHRYRLGESFTYLYGSTSGNYATTQAPGGQVPRVTDVQSINEIRALVRFTVVQQNGKLAKKLEILDGRYREYSKAQIQSSTTVPFKTLQSVIPKFPAKFTYTYPVDGDAEVARSINVLFQDSPDVRLYQLIDMFTFPTFIKGIPASLTVGQTVNKPGVDVDLAGTQYHSNNQVILFDRIDKIEGVNQAYLQNQGLGNYYNAFGIDSNVQTTLHVPLRGPANGLVSSGELQETTTQGAGTAASPRTVTQRQVSMTLQTASTRSAVDSYGADLKPRP